MTEAARRPGNSIVSWWPVVAIGALALATWGRPMPGGGAGPATGSAKGNADAAAVLEAGHGRRAASPAAIPARGWKDIAVRVYGSVNDNRILAVAAGVTFYVLLAIFPTIAALVSIYGLFADPATISDQLNSLGGVLPGGAIDIIGGEVKRLAANSGKSLSTALVISLALAMWSSNGGMKAVFDALNVAYGEKEKRSFIMLNLQSLGFTVAAIVLMVVALNAVVVVPIMLNFIGFGGLADTLIAVVRWPILLVLIVAAISALYRYGPSRTPVQWHWVSWGSAIAAVLWVLASLLFSFYVSRFGSYNATYGSLGAAIGFMTWIWISAIVILLGAEISAEIEHQTAHDTTTDGGKPMGARGAAMADEVGRAAG